MSRPRNNSLPSGSALRLNNVPRPRVRWTTTRHVVQAVPGAAANKQANIQAWPTGVAGASMLWLQPWPHLLVCVSIAASVWSSSCHEMTGAVLANPQQRIVVLTELMIDISLGVESICCLSSGIVSSNDHGSFLRMNRQILCKSWCSDSCCSVL